MGQDFRTLESPSLRSRPQALRLAFTVVVLSSTPALADLAEPSWVSLLLRSRFGAGPGGGDDEGGFFLWAHLSSPT